MTKQDKKCDHSVVYSKQKITSSLVLLVIFLFVSHGAFAQIPKYLAGAPQSVFVRMAAWAWDATVQQRQEKQQEQVVK